MSKVLVYKSSLLGYSETFIKEQVLALRRWRGILVGMKRSQQGLDLGGIELRMLGDLKKGWWQRLRWSLARHFDLAPPAVLERLAAEQASLIHIHFGTEAVRFWPIARALHLPVLVTLHGFDINTKKEWWEQGHGGRWMRKYPRRLLQMAASDRVSFIAVSDAIRQSAIAFGIPEEKVIVRHIGIDVEKFSPAGVPVEQRPPRVLFTGRLVAKKGAAHLIRAFARVRKSVPAAELVLAGDGPLRQSLEQLAASLDCPVTFLGSVPAGEVKRQMDLARVFCLPSVTAPNGDAEGFGMVILEAQACGVPVITSARGGAQEGIIDGQSGFAHAEGDEERIAAALERLLTDDRLAHDFSAAARRHAAHHFDIRTCTALLEQTYDQLCTAAAAGGS